MIEVQSPETRPAPIEVTTPIKPSEALRLGRLTRPVEREGEIFGGTVEACAIGAMALGYGWADPGDVGQYGDSPEDVYGFVSERVGLPLHNQDHPNGTPLADIWERNDDARRLNESGDAAVLAYLESRGL